MLNRNSKTIIVNPVFSAGKNLHDSISEKIRYTGGNTGNILFVESMKKHLSYIKETWVQPSELKGVNGNISMVMPSSNFIIQGNDNFTNLCIRFLRKTKFPFTMAGLGAQAT